ncbi:biotin-dependent carboxyltransferase family protein [Agromyces intestinalis]|uniref:Biotin-dependent carboxyltransferase family protein n=1 Tax=Agromyces intestinalis TaxID=2592652 RepID=A0A5C1YHR2_9MICO|nr:biotin-dependent carboxyltransferase family protein [Agromyces intestinalis]QEO15115.1 biotin-dependent carboxyltransferase family protein [Agromyces intestinalis]
MSAASGLEATSATEAPALEVLEPGPLALVEDLGRPGFAHLGVAPSGALDRGALAFANRLVGKPADAAGLELLGGGFRARFTASRWFAVTGAWGAVRLDGRRIAPDAAAHADAGSILELGTPERGLRWYLAVRGGLDEQPVLGSRSTDTLAGLGPRPVAAGRVLRFGAEPEASVPAFDGAGAPPPDGPVTLALRPGPRAEWFTDASRQALFDATWRCSPAADRVGVRLDGVPIERRVDGELPSEGTVPGSIQVPPSGLPVILLADRPVTGGYPVIAVVAEASLDAVAQLRPGQPVRFRHA